MRYEIIRDRDAACWLVLDREGVVMGEFADHHDAENWIIARDWSDDE